MRVMQRSGLFVSAMLVVLFSCVNLHGQKIPKTWTDDMVLEVSYGGGMRNYSTRLEIRKGGSFFETRDEGLVTRVALTFTQQQLDSLLAVLSDNQFDRIKTNPVMIYDKASTSISLSWSSNKVGVHNGSSAEIADGWTKNYWAIRDYINKMTER